MENVVGLKVLVHPVVLFTIVDGHERRGEGTKRVIGTLMGSKEKGVVEVHSGYAVPHHETKDEVAVDMDFDKEMSKLHQRVSSQEGVVGWFSSIREVTMHSVLIHDYYSRFDPGAVLLTLDTSMESGCLGAKAYIKSKVGLPGMTEGAIFTPIPCEVVYSEPESVGVDLLQRSRFTADGVIPVLLEIEQIQNVAESTDEALDQLMEYVDSVLDGRVAPDSDVGRLLSDTLSRVPQIDTVKFETTLNQTMQDLLMVMYLGNLTKTQLSLGGKLTQIAS